MTLPNLAPRKILVFLFLFLIALYSLFQARFLILGPTIKVTTPNHGEVASSPLIMVKGIASNVAYLTLNGRQIYTDTSGHFEEKLILNRGQSIITLIAKDRFGRETEKQITVVLN